MKSDVKLSEVLRYAANVVLDPDTFPVGPYNGDLRQYSCDAVNKAVKDLHPKRSWNEHDEIIQFYRAGALEMGIDLKQTDVYDSMAAEHRQGARYMWLDLAALMAEEQGI